jgi:hypothetical protein
VIEQAVLGQKTRGGLMSKDKEPVASKSIKSLIDQFELKDLPSGIKYELETAEKLCKGKFCDGDIENVYALVRQGFSMANKTMPPAFTHQAVRNFYKL